MVCQQITNQNELVKIEKWVHETYPETGRFPEEIQLLILYKLHQLEERLEAVEPQTKTRWVN